MTITQGNLNPWRLRCDKKNGKLRRDFSWSWPVIVLRQVGLGDACGLLLGRLFEPSEVGFFLYFSYIFSLFLFLFFYWDGFSRLQRWLSLRSCRWQEAVKAATTCPQNSKQKSHRYTSGDPPHHFHVHWSIGLIARRSGHSCLENNNNNCTRDRNPLKNLSNCGDS